MPGAMLLDDDDPMDEGALLELFDEKLLLDEEGNDVEKDEFEEDDADPVAFTPTTSITIIGEVAVCAHWMLNVMDFVTTTFSLPLVGTPRFGPQGAWLPSVSQRCTPLEVQEMVTVLPIAAFTVPSWPLIFTSIAENPPVETEELELPKNGGMEDALEDEVLLDELLEDEETGSAQVRVSMNGWREQAALRIQALPFQYSMKLSPQLAKFLLRRNCTREYPASSQIFCVVAASSSIATPSWYGLMPFSMKKK